MVLTETDNLKNQIASLKEIISIMEQNTVDNHKENFPLQDPKLKQGLEILT